MPSPSTSTPPIASLTPDSISTALFLARTNDSSALLDLSTSLNIPTSHLLSTASDPETGNTPLHYAAANGHVDLAQWIIDTVRHGHARTKFADGSATVQGVGDEKGGQSVMEVVARTNGAGSTPLHYAAMTGQLEVCKVLVDAVPVAPDAGGGEGDRGGMSRVAFVRWRNKAGRDAVVEAEVAGWEEVAGWLVGTLQGVEDGVVQDKGEAGRMKKEGVEEVAGVVGTELEMED